MSRLPTRFPRLAALLGLAALLALLPARAQQAAAPPATPAAIAFDAALGGGPVFIVPVEGMIDAGLARYVDRALGEAEDAEAALVLLHVDTFGGLVDAADEIRQAILHTQLPTLAYIDPNAASAGALISLAADRIAIAPGGSIGAATVVDGTGTKASEKMQSYMRGLMRATAEANGRDPRLAEAMVDESIEVEGVIEEGKLLTLSAGEAVRLGLADAELPTLDAVLEAAGVAGQERVDHRASGAERVLRFLGSPVMASLLMMMMLGGLYFELQTPGVGFAGAMAAVGAAMFFAPHYLLGMVESWEVVLFGLGLALLFAEVFIIPGFGVAGIAGIVLTLFALGAALIPNVGFQFPEGGDITRAILTLAATLVLLVVFGFSVGRYLPRSTRLSAMVLAPSLTAAEGYTSPEEDAGLEGETGVAVTPLRPSGVAEVLGRRVDVVAPEGYVPVGAAVEVMRVRGSRVEVRRLPEAPPAGAPAGGPSAPVA